MNTQQAACSPLACQVSVVEWGASGGIRTHLKPLMAGDVSWWTLRCIINHWPTYFNQVDILDNPF